MALPLSDLYHSFNAGTGPLILPIIKKIPVRTWNNDILSGEVPAELLDLELLDQLWLTGTGYSPPLTRRACKPK